MMLTTIKQPETKKEFEAYYDLRWSVLRQPWQQPKGSEKDELEKQSFHIMACDENNNVIAVGRLHFNNQSEAQIRYMAVKPEHQNKGFGKSILKSLEEKCRQEKCEVIILDARESALSFYQKQGYQIIKKSHLLYDVIQHYQMIKEIK